MTDEEIERIAEAVARKLERSRMGMWDLATVAEYLGRSESGVRQMVYDGEFPRPDMGGGRGAKMAWKTETVTGFKPVRA